MKRIRRIIRALDPKADATMGQRERLEAFRIRRAAVLVLVLFLLIGAFTLLLFATSKSWIFYEGGDDK